MTIEIRVTHPLNYLSPGCAGYDCLSAREGNYPTGDSVEDAAFSYLRRNDIPLIDVQKDGEYIGRFTILYRGTEDERLVKLPTTPVSRDSTKHVETVTVTDPDTKLPCEVEIRKTGSGVLVGFDAAYLEQLGDDENPRSPYDENTLLVVPDDED